MCLIPLSQLDMNEMWIISDGVNDVVLEDLGQPWKVRSVLEHEIIRTQLPKWAEIRGMRITGNVDQTLEVSLGYSINRTLDFKYMVS